MRGPPTTFRPQISPRLLASPVQIASLHRTSLLLVQSEGLPLEKNNSNALARLTTLHKKNRLSRSHSREKRGSGGEGRKRAPTERRASP